METTKLTVEYLIVGVLVCLAIIFLASSVAPVEVGSFWLNIVQYPSQIGAGLIVMFLPIAYGVGLLAEYLGMILYENRMRQVKEKRFPVFIQQNLEWLKKNPLLGKYVQKDQPIPSNAGELVYGEMRFYTLMQNASLYAEIESHLNQARIIRVLTISEILFIAGFIIQFINKGIELLPAVICAVLFILLFFNTRAVIHRFNQYCRAIERSYKVLSIEKSTKRAE